ncbi:gamma carbonic anhydrase family protein [Haloterrigena sp. SYSU A121-1]|uniref:Gamma carbonic anhydrase family protein n=1 Tax=Haloterrigena gelatinilytica TaxID=2741724 RepID=A0A8J8GNF9_9EURY|nr:gamma carbonic anhydrase family protein [Haloterrigena gelatinilytica]NUB93289.1 gamma carbonic anhydrase family protein [Haloterrigena gelatinilytica]
MVDSRTYAFEGTQPTVDDAAAVSREATLVGDVRIDAEASVWPGVVLRGDIGPVRVGEQAHIGDNATIHASTLADRVMIGHGAVLNEATVEEGTLIGFNATVNTESTVGAGSVVAAGTVIPDEYDIPPESFARGVPAEITPLEETGVDAEAIFEEFSSGEYTNLAGRHEELFD